jgi:tetratricopeptide (TPR) repeat protein
MDSYRLEIFEQREDEFRLRLFDADGTLFDERDFDKSSLDNLLIESDRYYETLRGNPAAIGQSLHNWLDGAASAWLRQLRSQHGAVALYITVDERMRHLPWELLLDRGSYFSVDPSRPIVPIRRIGVRIERKPPQNRPLRVLFMAASPVDVNPVLAFEEEEARILSAARKSGLELIVEESGTLKGLQERIDSLPEDYIDVVHLTGHADVDRGHPVFLCETEKGLVDPVDADDISKAFLSSGRFPRLVFLSGCSTGKAADQGSLPSLSEALVRAGVPAVLGWSLPVGDQTATVAASELYERLANGVELDRAVAHVRRILSDLKSPYWSFLRLYTADSNASESFVTPIRHPGRAHLQRIQIHQRFLDANSKVEVCPPERFVGRRRELQQALRVLTAVPGEDDYAEAVLLHGIGGLGKSSLAARICNRLSKTHRILVWVGRIDETAVRHVINGELATADGLKALNDRGLPLGAWLRTILEEHLIERPALFVFDDFEQNLELGDASVAWRNHPALTCMQDLLDGLHHLGSASRVLITSRYEPPPFRDMQRIHSISVPSLQGGDQEKIVGSLDHLGSKKNIEIRDKAISLAAGNPRLLHRMDRVLGSAQVDHNQLLKRLDAAREEFREELILRELIAVLDAPRRRFLARLSVHGLPVPEHVLQAHRRSIAFDIQYETPLLEPEADLASDQLTPAHSKPLAVFDYFISLLRSTRRLARTRFRRSRSIEPDFQDSFELDDPLEPHDPFGRGDPWIVPVALGLLEERRSQVQERMYFISPVVSDLFEHELDTQERFQAVYDGANALFDVWNRARAYEEWDQTVELRRLSLEARLPVPLEMTTAIMTNRLMFDQARTTKRLCEEALEVVNSPRLFDRLAVAELSLGNGDEAEEILRRALSLAPPVEEERQREAYLAQLKLSMARLFLFRGMTDSVASLVSEVSAIAARAENPNLDADLNAVQAMLDSRHEPKRPAQAISLAQASFGALRGMPRSALTAMRMIGEGKYEEARDYLRNSVIPEAQDNPVVCTGAKQMLADVLIQLNEFSEAAKIIEIEIAPALEDFLGGIGKVIAHQKLAQILAANRKFAEALQTLVDVEPIVAQSDNVVFTVKFKEHVAGLLASTGQHGRALEIAQRSLLPAYERIKDARGIAATKLIMVDALFALERSGDALEILLDEVLPACEHFEDGRWKAETLERAAYVIRSRGHNAEALRILRERVVPTWQSLGDERRSASALTSVASLLQSRGDRHEAQRILREQVLPVWQCINDDKGIATTLVELAGAVQSLGDLDQALGILREQVLPIWERLRDDRQIAATLIEIANVISSSGDRGEALKTLRDDVIPIWRRLKDDREIAQTLARMADILFSSGNRSEVRRMLDKEVLPIWERLRDDRKRALTHMRIADVLQSGGDREEALRILREEVLPVWQRFKDDREIARTLSRMATILQSAGDRSEALQILRAQVLPIWQRLNDDRETAGTLARMADVEQSRGDRSEALRLLREEALPIWRRLKDNRGIGGVTIRVGEMLQAYGDRGEAERILRDEALPIWRQLKDDQWITGTFFRIANVAHSAGNRDEALRLLREEVLPGYQLLNDKREIARTLSRIADILQSGGDRDEASRMLREEVLPAWQQLKDDREIARTFGHMAEVEQSRGDRGESIRLLREEALPIWHHLNDDREVGTVLFRISEISQASGDRNEAERILREEALPVWQRLKDERWTTWTFSRIAGVLQSQGDRDEALRILREKVLPVWQRAKDDRELATTHVRIADVLQTGGDRNEALKILREAVLPIWRQLKDDREIAGTLARIASVLQSAGDRDEALRVLRTEVLPVWQRLKDDREIAGTFARIADAEQSGGNRDEALRTLRDDALPIWERLCDHREISDLLDRIADVELARGNRDEALKILRDKLTRAEQPAEAPMPASCELKEAG